MKTVIGIAVLVVCAIGAVSVLFWVFQQAAKLFKPYGPGTLLKVGRSEEYIEKKLTKWEELPHYKGRTWLFGLPHYRDVMMPNKHNYSTVAYMDHPVRQYVYDVMCIWKSTCDGFSKEGVGKSWFYALFFPIMFIIAGFSFIKVLIVTSVIFVGLYLWYLPSGMPMERRSGELAKNLTFADWQKIDIDVAKDLAEEERLVSALRRSGTARWW